MESPMDPANEAEGFIKERMVGYGYGYRWSVTPPTNSWVPKKSNQKNDDASGFPKDVDMLNNNTLKGNDP